VIAQYSPSLRTILLLLAKSCKAQDKKEKDKKPKDLKDVKDITAVESQFDA